MDAGPALRHCAGVSSHGRPPTRREQRYYLDIAELESAIERNAAGGWRVVLAGRVSNDKYWAQYEDASDPPAVDGPV